MSLNFLHVLLFLSFAVEIDASTTVLPSSTVQSSSLPATSTVLPAETSPVVPTPSLSSVNTASASPVKPYISASSAVQPSSTSSPSSSSAPTSQPTKQSKTRSTKPGRIGKPVGLVMGFVFAYVALVTAFFIYFFVVGTGINRETRKELTEGLSISGEVVGTQVKEEQDAGITHEAFVEDSDGFPDGLTKNAAPYGPSDGTTNVAAPDPKVEVKGNDDFAHEVTSF